MSPILPNSVTTKTLCCQRNRLNNTLSMRSSFLARTVVSLQETHWHVVCFND